MYLDYYGLIEKPFSLTPDPKYFFASGCHAEARDLLRYGVREREGFMCFVGAAGTGKTTLLRTVLEGFGTDVVTALVLNPFLSEEDLLRIVLIDFGIATRAEFEGDRGRSQSKQQLIDRLNDHLMNLSLQGKTAVLVIDEAQNLPMPVMEQIRLLSNLETSKSKLLQIVLAGQLGLRRLLTAPELSQLAQRVSVRYTLQPLSFEEIGRYIDHRLRIAGSQGDIVFDHTAIERILRYSEGVPRLVNLLADRALLAGYAQRSHTISAETIERAAETLDLTLPGVTPPVERVTATGTVVAAASRPWGVAVAGAALAAAVAVAGVWRPWAEPQGLTADPPARAEAAPSTQPLVPESATAATPGVGSTPQGAFTVYLSSFRQPDDRQLTSLRERLTAAGLSTHLVAADVPGQGRLYRLVAGAFDDASTARAVARGLNEKLGVSHAEVVSVADVTGK